MSERVKSFHIRDYPSREAQWNASLQWRKENK